jgi:pimeloyl-ACP methyl ester carboxylesterase
MLIAAVRERGVAIDVFAHSLGTRVAVKTLGRIAAQPGSSDAVRRAVLLGGAEYSIDALAATRSLSTDCYNFVIRGDWVLRKGASEMGGRNRPPNTMRSRVIGRDGMKRAPHWIDFQLDHTDDENAAVFRSWFERLGGYQVSGERIAGRGEHWAYYLHPGNRALYCAILEEEGLTVDWMRRNGAPDGVDRFQYDSLRGTPPKTPMTCRGRRRLYGWEA